MSDTKKVAAVKRETAHQEGKPDNLEKDFGIKPIEKLPDVKILSEQETREFFSGKKAD